MPKAPRGGHCSRAPGLGRGPSPEPVNAFLIRRGDRHWLLDGGCGTVFGPGFDRVGAALAAQGVRPEQIERDGAGYRLA